MPDCEKWLRLFLWFILDFSLYVSLASFFLSLCLNKIHRYYLQFWETQVINHFQYISITGT